ncbi:hypothetical protein HN51_045260, partial [Arachis hypogaea]
NRSSSLNFKESLAKGVAVGISIAGTSGVLPLLICACVRYFQKEKEKIKFPTEDFISSSTQDELAKATNNFSSDNKIGQGRFGAVYFAKLRCQKAAIKNMDVQASTEFLSELMVLKHDHHLNLVTMLVTLFQGVNLWHGQQGCKLLWIQQEDLNIYMNTLFLFISTVM